MEHRATKCNAVVGRWSKAKWTEDRRWIVGGVEEVVRIKDLHEGTEEEVLKVETGSGQRALGVQVNMEGLAPGTAGTASWDSSCSSGLLRMAGRAG